MEESGSPYDVGSLSETVQSILFTPQDHGIPMQTRGITKNYTDQVNYFCTFY